MSLGDYFPENIKKEYAEHNIQPGTVFRFFVRDTYPPKPKFFIVLAADENHIMVATVFINSEINNNIFPTPELKALHYKISSNTYSFLDHDSYIDCSQLRERPIENLKKDILTDPENVKGNLTVEDFTIIRDIIIRSDSISSKIKRKFNLFFE